MREIKFRAWVNDDKRMLPYEIAVGNNRVVELLKNDDMHPELFTENLIIMQYVGLKDKNGKEIYEGDIIRDSWHALGNPNREIVSSVSEVKWEIKKEEGEYDAHEDGFSGFSNNWNGEIEVIGNIYENPELLKTD